jgi:hypothetical protein
MYSDSDLHGEVGSYGRGSEGAVVGGGADEVAEGVTRDDVAGSRVRRTLSSFTTNNNKREKKREELCYE